jgi:hypothetical protein
MKSRTFKFPRKYYDTRILYKKSEATINSGITILVGCNGCGKSTLELIIKERLKQDHIKYFEYDNEKDGGGNAMSLAGFNGNLNLVADMYASSEGENITINLSENAVKISKYIRTGEIEGEFSKIINILHPEENCCKEEYSNERWIFFDAIDSGYSIDNIIDFKKLLNVIMEDSEKLGLDTYIIASANAYETCVDLPTFSVIDCKYIDINSYEEYKKFILKTSVYKDKQINKYNQFIREKLEAEKLKEQDGRYPWDMSSYRNKME